MKTKLFLIISIFLFSSFSFGENIHDAAKKGDINEIEKLVDKEIKQYQRYIAYLILLQSATKRGNIKKIRQLLNKENKYKHLISDTPFKRTIKGKKPADHNL